MEEGAQSWVGNSRGCALLMLLISNISCHAVGSVGLQDMPCRWCFNIYFVGLISGRRFASYHPSMTVIGHVPPSEERGQNYGEASCAKALKILQMQLNLQN
jgi:hypothetical protein